ncbi:hypothetical protein CFN58_06115 [Pseudomonas avellanae]|uniref:Uncharacterized protein n=2 Tax=Pseudomonas syringae group TaxID=136849 RepID=A0A261WMA0_9PSED|nr:hypothetical protein [Pseudomonas syringae]OZI87100.1 hypothetical protein CFN58_06115 [Pseudomonas avellanae]ATV20453.1 hypothetical protein CT122_29535 [Pseudomonas syringae pv. actinidiae]NYS40414.1 hypothetical protein [Pseudomonas syringae pv. actinidiae]PIN59734.1 hypothetical protein CUB86_20295 [Pseudomonas syringae pv. actinidiae]GAO95222.1 hypothetical protein PSA5_20915 [Pseudomonas syringae pv. actinidiae]
MSINQLRMDVEEHFQLFDRVPFKEAWRRRDARICLVLITAFMSALSGALIFLPGAMLTDYMPNLLPVLLVFMICAVRLAEVYELVRAEKMGAGPTTTPLERSQLRQRWFCTRYQCGPDELVDKARVMRHLWEAREELKRLASNDTMGPRIAAFFLLPDPARFIGMLFAIAAIFTTMITLGSNIDAIFAAIQDWRTIGANIVIGTFLSIEIVWLWIMVTGMINEVGPSLLEQMGLLPVSNRRVYRYLLAVHNASEPVTPVPKAVRVLLKVSSVLFMSLQALWAKVRSYLSVP